MSERKHVSTGAVWEDRYGYSRAVRAGNVIHVAGTGPVFPDGSCPDDARLQADRAFSIALDALATLGGARSDVVRTRMYVTSAEVQEAVGLAHKAAVGEARPAATMIIIAGLADPRWHVEIELEAIVD